MTVAELIERLSKFRPDMRVAVRGYEGGYDDLEFKMMPLILDHPDGGGVYGIHGPIGPHEYAKLPVGHEWEGCVVLDRPGR